MYYALFTAYNKQFNHFDLFYHANVLDYIQNTYRYFNSYLF